MFKKKINEMDANEIQATDMIVQRTLDRLMTMFAGAAERSINALFLINGGGAVAVLAYFHDGNPDKNIWLLASLMFFLSGLILAVVVVGIDYYIAMRTLNNYASNIKKLNEAKIDLTETQNLTNCCIKKLGSITIVIGYFAAFLFVMGIIAGLIGYIINLTL